MNLMAGRPGLFSHTEEQEISLLSPHTYQIHQQDSNNGSGGNEDNDDTDIRMFLGSSAVVVEKEHMFDKVVTPSDVGKLNRLVIPKQHAEKYFPLDSSTNDKGLLLNFEDRDGKQWRFRYSYWNSSQSYVMTKGWSRFVKEKKLDAGDVVSFQRGLGELVKDRLFIDWRRRPNAPAPLHHHWNPLFGQPPRDVVYSQLMQHNNHHIMNGYAYAPNNYAYSSSSTSSRVVNGNPCPPGSIVYLRADPLQGAASIAQQPMVIESVPVVVQGRATAKRLRLFGVNMDCPIPVDELDECDVRTSSSPTSSSSSLSDFRHYLRPYSNHTHEKGKGSVSSLDLDI